MIALISCNKGWPKLAMWQTHSFSNAHDPLLNLADTRHLNWKETMSFAYLNNMGGIDRFLETINIKIKHTK